MRKTKKYLIILSLILLFFYFCGGPDKLRKGDEALNSGEYEKALHYYTKSLEENPTNSSIKERIARCYYWLGETSYEEGKIEQAIEYLKKSGIEDAYLKLAEIYYEEGDKNFEEEQYEEAIKNYKEVEKIIEEGEISFPDEESLLSKIGESLYFLGEREFDKGNYKKAQTFFKQVEKDYIEYLNNEYQIDVYYKLFRIYFLQKDYENSLYYLSLILDKEPDYEFGEEDYQIFQNIYSFLMKKAERFFREKEYEKAIELIEKMEVLPNFKMEEQNKLKAKILVEEGNELLKSGKEEEALEKFKQAKELYKGIRFEMRSMAEKYIKEGIKLQRKRKYKEAVDKFLLAYKISPEIKKLEEKYIPHAFYLLGYLSFKKQKYKESLQFIKKGLSYNPEYKYLKILLKKWENRVYGLQRNTEKELKRIIDYINIRYKNAVPVSQLLGKYRGKRIKWQVKPAGIVELNEKVYGKFKVKDLEFYGLPASSINGERFTEICKSTEDNSEIIIKGKLSYVEKGFFNSLHLVVEIYSIKVVELIDYK